MSEFNEHRVNILLVDDEEDYIITGDILAEIKEWRFDLKWIAEYDTALKVIETSQFDVCLADYHLGARSSHPGCPFTLPINVPAFTLSNNGAFPWKEVGKSFTLILQFKLCPTQL